MNHYCYTRHYGVTQNFALGSRVSNYSRNSMSSYYDKKTSDELAMSKIQNNYLSKCINIQNKNEKNLDLV